MVLKIKGSVTDFKPRLGLVENPGQVVTLKFQYLQVNIVIHIFCCVLWRTRLSVRNNVSEDDDY